MINLPIAPRIAFRGSRLLPARRRLHRQRPRARGPIAATRSTTPTAPTIIGCVHNGIHGHQRRSRKEQFQRPGHLWRPGGAEDRPRRQLDRHADLHVPEDSRPTASSSTIPKLGDLKIDRFRKEPSKDRFWQAALTVEGKIANFDVTYAGAYMDRPTIRHQRLHRLHRRLRPISTRTYGGIANYFYFHDAAGNHDRNPQQYIIGTNHFKKMSHELRIASPADKPFRVIAGAFYQRQTNYIHQDYQVDGLGPGAVGQRLSRDLVADPAEARRQGLCAVRRGELRRHAADHADRPAAAITSIDNTLIGFFGFGRNPAFGEDCTTTSAAQRARAASRPASPQCFTDKRRDAARSPAERARTRRCSRRRSSRAARAPTSACSRTARSSPSAPRTTASPIG